MRKSTTAFDLPVRRGQRRYWGGRVLAIAALVTAFATAPAAATAQLGEGRPLAGQATEGAEVAAPAAAEVLALSETGRWIVELSGPSVAPYGGGIANLSATSPEASGA